MSIETKKKLIADKMYTQNSKGGKGSSSKYTQGAKGNSVKVRTAKGTGKGGGQGYGQSNAKGSFVAKYSQADKNGSIKGGYKQSA